VRNASVLPAGETAEGEPVLPRVIRTRPCALLSIVLFAVMTMVAAQLVMDGPVTSQPPLKAQRTALQGHHAAIEEAAAAMAAAIVRPITPPPPPAPAPTAAAAVAPSEPGAVPTVGQATAWGCGAALAYLQTYAAKGFTLECPGYAEGREAMTCMNQAGACPGTSVIAISDPCPQAYMNEASNSYVILGVAETPIDPFGACP
jgi:hypothetical protein